MNFTIVEAIANKQRLVVTYNGSERVVEPHTYGLDKNGVGKLRVFQVSDDEEHAGWRLFNEDAMSDLKVPHESFANPATGYMQDDKHFLTVYAQL